jgi:hypothetical protein
MGLEQAIVIAIIVVVIFYALQKAEGKMGEPWSWLVPLIVAALVVFYLMQRMGMLPL